MPTPKLEDSQLEIAVDAYYAHKGNKSQAAKSIGIHRRSLDHRLEEARRRFKIKIDRVADGKIEAEKTKTRKRPKRGRIQRYILTSAQNNTHLHPGWETLITYRDYLDGLDNADCEIIVGTYSYQTATYGKKAVKRGTYNPVTANEELWYDPAIEPYIIDVGVEIAPGLVWCGEQNILPTSRNPLVSFEDYNGRKSNIVPHAKTTMESVASMANEPTKFNFTTGTITQRNYIQKRAGILAGQSHSYGALLVEVDSDGNWFVRQLHIDDDNVIMDVGPQGSGGVRVSPDEVTETDVVKSIYWGDAHAAELSLWIRKLAWGSGGMLDTLRPTHQFIGDIFSMRSRSHHETHDFHRSYRKHAEEQESVQEEVQLTTDFANDANRPWCEMIIVPSNHDRHLDRWLNEFDFRRDPLNAKYFCLLQYQILDAIDRDDVTFNILEYAMRSAGLDVSVRFLPLDESCVIAGIENGLHGDLGPNGSNGSTRALTKLGRPINKGHDHTAAIRGVVYSAGACAEHFSYSKGPNSHSVSHIVTYENGSRAIVTMWSGKWRA